MSSDLSTATFDELWDEITRRFRGAILMVDGDDKLPGTFCYRFRDHGTPAHVLGMAEMLHRDIAKKVSRLEDEFDRLNEDDESGSVDN